MKDIIETAAICTGCAALAGAFLSLLGFVTTEIIAPALGFSGGQASLVDLAAGFFS